MTLSHLISRTRTLGRTLSGLSSLGIGNRATYDDVLRLALEADPEVYGTWTVWEPGALDGCDGKFRNRPGHDASGRYIPFWFNDGAGTSLEPNTNYEHPGIGDYYCVPRTTQTEQTIREAPYIHCSGEATVFTCHVVPILRGSQFLGVAGIDVLPDKIESDTDRAVLSPREEEVFQWVVAGKTNAEIGTILGISSHTAKHHVAKILAKLGLENRKAAICAFHNG